MDNTEYDILSTNSRKLKGVKVALYALESEIKNGNISNDLDKAMELLGDQIADIAKSIDTILGSS